MTACRLTVSGTGGVVYCSAKLPGHGMSIGIAPPLSQMSEGEAMSTLISWPADVIVPSVRKGASGASVSAHSQGCPDCAGVAAIDARPVELAHLFVIAAALPVPCTPSRRSDAEGWFSCQ